MGVGDKKHYGEKNAGNIKNILDILSTKKWKKKKANAKDLPEKVTRDLKTNKKTWFEKRWTECAFRTIRDSWRKLVIRQIIRERKQCNVMKECKRCKELIFMKKNMLKREDMVSFNLIDFGKCIPSGSV